MFFTLTVGYSWCSLHLLRVIVGVLEQVHIDAVYLSGGTVEEQA